jgi:branched-chain amino acid transport system permease protein
VNYWLHILVMIGIYTMLAYSLNLVIGFGGLLSLCHGAFYGIGAYAFALLTTKAGVSFLPALGGAVLITGVVAFLVSVPALRFRGDLYVVVTLGFQVIIFTILYNWVSLTSGPYGIPGIPRPEFGGIQVSSVGQFAALVGSLCAVLMVVLFLLYRSPYGLSLKALRDDEPAAQSLGLSPFRQYAIAMVLSGSLAAIPGVCFATYVTYIDPTSFTLRESIFQASILLVGGSGNRKGPLVGAVFMVLLPELLRFVGLPVALAANLREIIYGLLLIVFMYWRPQGLAGEFRIR